MGFSFIFSKRDKVDHFLLQKVIHFLIDSLPHFSQFFNIQVYLGLLKIEFKSQNETVRFFVDKEKVCDRL